MTTTGPVACPKCQDTGVTLSYWPRSVDDAPEYDPCVCLLGKHLEQARDFAAERDMRKWMASHAG